MRTLGDVVLEHAKRWSGDTLTGLQLLELRNVPENYSAANHYIAALRIIQELQKEIQSLHEEAAGEDI